MNPDTTILVTGANGQLGSELRAIAPRYPQYRFLFSSRNELPIDDPAAMEKYFSSNRISYCVNCAAYTAVDKAENDKENAFRINADAAGNLARICRLHQAQLFHISTDYVFDGNGAEPYKETDPTAPLGVYGASKLQGERLVQENDPTAIIIRTAWVYSSFGNNFVKTMLRLMKERDRIGVVNDQWGSPTYAADLAAAILQLIASGDTGEKGGVYHYSNTGIISWYQFAVAIKELTGSACTVDPITTDQYPTPARRPKYSVLDTKKIRDTFGIRIPDWKTSLQSCLTLL